MNRLSLQTSKRLLSTAAVATAPSSSHAPRVPLIKFVGKRDPTKHYGHSKRPAVAPQSPPPQQIPVITVATPNVSKKEVKHTPNAVDFFTLKDKAFHGRPKISEAESNSINSGGIW